MSRAVVAHAFNPRTREAEAGRSLRARGQPGLQELVPGQAPKSMEKPCLKNKKKLCAIIGPCLEYVMTPGEAT